MVAVWFFFAFNGFGQPWTYNFGTGTGVYNTSGGTSTTFLPQPTSGNDFIRLSANGGSFNLENSGLASLGSDSEFRIVAPTGGSVNKFSIYDYSASKVFYTKFSVLFGNSTGANTATSGTWFFFQGDGATYNDANGFNGAQVFSGLQFVYGAAGALTTSYRNAAAWTAISTPAPLPITQANIYTFEIYGNNSTTSQDYERGTTYSIAANKWDLWINGTLVGDDLSKASIANNVNIDSWMFYSINSIGNVANIFLDDFEYSNALPAAGCPVTITGINPTSGPPGTVVTLTGTNFTGTSAVTYNSVAVSSYSVINSTTIEATIPAGTAVGTTATFTVTQGCDVTSSSSFTVTCPVSVTSFSPTSGPIGTLVTITGTDFTGSTGVTFNGISASSYTVVNATTMTARVPEGATTGKIAVTQGCIGTSSGDFTVIGQSGTCSSSTHINENIQSWTNRGSYGSYTQVIPAGTVTMTRCIVSSAASASGTGTIGRVQMEGTTGIIELPQVSDVSSVQFNLVAGAAGRSVKLQSYNGADWDDITTFTGINTTGATFSYTINSAIPTTLRLASPSSAVYVHDIIVNSVASTSVNITTQPVSQSQCDGEEANFSVVATGSPTYQWHQHNGTLWSPLGGETNATLTIPVVLGMDGYQYYCVVTEGSCNVPTNAVQLTISGSCCLAPADEPTMLVFSNITASSLDVDWTAPASGCGGYVVKIGTDASFDPLVDGTSLPSGSSAPWNDEDIVLTGSDRTGFTIGSLDENTVYYFKVYPYNLCGSTYKFNNTGLAGTITTSTQTYPTPVCAQGAVTLSLVNTNETNAEYQWQVFDGSSWSDIANGGSYSGATARELVIDPVLQTMNGYIYVCQVSNSAHGCVTPSVSFTLTVNALPDTPIIESVTQNCGNTVLNMGTTPAGVTWYWQGTVSNGTATANSDPTYTVLSGAEGTYYLRAVSTDGCWSTNSDSRIVTVKQVPVATLTLTAGCGSGSALIESDLNFEQTFELLDNLGNSLVPPRSATVTGLSHTFNGIVSGDYTATVTYNGCASALTAIGTLTNTIISGEPTASDETICGAGTATLTATLGTNADRIEWSLDGVFTDGLNGDETDSGFPFEYDVALADGQTIPVYVRSNNAGNCPSGWEIVNAISTETITTPTFIGGLETVHCPGTANQTFTATAVRGTVVYSLDVTTGAPITPPTINSATGVVTYNDDFVGTITITATVNGCNGPLTDTHEVTMVKHGTTGIIAL